MPVSLSPDIVVDLKARHLAFLEARLASPRAAEEWSANAASVYVTLLGTRIGDVIDATQLADAFDSVLTADAVNGAVSPVARRLLPILLKTIYAQKGPLDAWVPDPARANLDALLEHRGIVPDRLIREIVAHEAVEEVMRDVLFDGLKEFSEKLNPFTAEWGIPSILKRIAPFGVGIGKGFESMRTDFDRRLEPEIRRFLVGFTRRGLRRMVEGFLRDAHEPKGIALRKHLCAWLLHEELGDLARGLNPEIMAMAQAIGLDITAFALTREELRTARRAVISDALAAVSDRTVGEAFADLGVTFEPDVAVLARATWPMVRTALSSPAVKAWIAAVVGEFYDVELAST